MNTFFSVISILGFVIFLIMLIVSKITKSKNSKRYFTGLGICIVIIIICISTSSTGKNNSNDSISSNSNSDNKVEQVKSTEDIKALQEKYKPLLENGKNYKDMTDEEGKNANDLIADWDKLEEDFKTSYQSQKDTISKSIDEYNSKNKKEEEAKKVAEEEASYNTGITYEQLARTPDDYKDKKVKLAGKVIQVIDGKNEINLRVAVDGEYNNILFVKYDPSIINVRILVDDQITIHGKSLGIYTYLSLGGDISIPSVQADKIELSK